MRELRSCGEELEALTSGKVLYKAEAERSFEYGRRQQRASSRAVRGGKHRPMRMHIFGPEGSVLKVIDIGKPRARRQR